MSSIKPSSHGIVVDHKETGVRYAISDKNYNEKVHRKVRDLKPGETVRTYAPKQARSAEELEEVVQANSPKTEGSAPAGTKG